MSKGRRKIKNVDKKILTDDKKKIKWTMKNFNDDLKKCVIIQNDAKNFIRR